MRRAFSIAIAMMIVGCGFSFGEDEFGREPDLASAPGRRARDAGNQTTDDDASSGGTTTTDASATPPPTTDAAANDGAKPPPAGPLKAFVSSAIVNGNLGGVAGADKLCNDLAKAQALAGTYVAWISTANVNAIDRITANGPWQDVTGDTVATTKAQLASGTLANDLDRDEKGAKPPLAEDRVWTATGPDGKFVGGASDCGGWTGAGVGRVGEAEHEDAKWTSLVDEPCTEINRVYCFQNQ